MAPASFTLARCGRHLLLAAGLLALCGCPNASLYRTARPLAVGESEVGAVWSAVAFQRGDVSWFDGAADRQRAADLHVTGNAVPEVSYHRGITADLDVGGRVGLSSASAEIDVKYRVYYADALHVAVAPAVGWAPWGDVKGARVTLPVLAAYELGPSLALNAGLHAGYQWVDLKAVPPYLKEKDVEDLRWSVGKSAPVYGVGVGAEWHDDRFFVRPMVEASHHAGEIGLPGAESTYDVWSFRFTLAGGWTFGKDVAALRRTDEQLDRLLQPKAPPGP